MSDWIFQANPKRYDLLAAAATGSDDRWSMKVHRDRVAVGDKVWFLISGREAGLYVMGTIASPVYETEDDGFGAWKVNVDYNAFLKPPLLRAELLAIPALANFFPLRGMMGTNFAVPPAIAEVLRDLVTDRLQSISTSTTTVPEAISLDQALQRHNDAVRRDLKAAISALSSDEFEQLVGKVLEALGFQDIDVVGKSGDGGVDVRAWLSLQGITSVHTVVQAKRWTNTVGPRVVRELRGSLQVEERGLIITTAEFSPQAIDEAAVVGRAPIGLMGGVQLTRICMENGIGVESLSVPIYKLNAGRLT